MSYNVISTTRFIKEAKKLLKRYTSLKSELISLNTTLQNNPNMGVPLGNNTYKIRLAIKSKGKGKSGGARIITYSVTADREIYLLTI
jgi:mRNA-degrading endonuclease RelE of RelBE toxin-antitoxin system